MPYNLLVEPIAPFRMASGERRWLGVAEALTHPPDGDFAVEPAWRRADLDTATYEMMIGLVAIAFRPADIADWLWRCGRPPTMDDIGAALVPLAPAFDVDGDGRCFMQEAGLDGEIRPVEALFIDTPGANAQKKNADLLTHRHRFSGLCLPAAAMALYALQAFAPAGGAGNRTSMRGGGPLTALVIPAADDGDTGCPPPSLWQTLWANVVPQGHRRSALPPAETVFAWLRDDLPVGRSKGSAEIHQTTSGFDAELHPFFGMPRRIRLVAPQAVGRCALTGRDGPLVTGFVQKPHGLNYGRWRHPLTPYRRQKPGDLAYSVKPKSGRFGYRDWVAATLGDRQKSRGGKGRQKNQRNQSALSLPAENVQFARTLAASALLANGDWSRARLRVTGWAMDNMEAISYLAAEHALPLAAPERGFALDTLARAMAETGGLASGALRLAIKTVLGTTAEQGAVEQARTDFFDRTDDAFHRLFGAALRGHHVDHAATGHKWLARLRRTALAVFDETCPVPLGDAERAGTVIQGRSMLVFTFAGGGKAGGVLYDALGLGRPERRAIRREEPYE